MLLLALLWQVASTTQPPLPPLHGGPKEMTCPVGGERFSAWQPTHYSTFGERPDGKPYGYLPFPFPLPECPSNRLIVFGEFTAAERAALARLIATREYRALVGTETSYYRAWWLATRIGRTAPEALGLLLSATWQVAPGELFGATTRASGRQFARYQRLFIDRVGGLPAGIAADDRVWLQARAANAARQLGRFDEAEALRRRAVATLAAQRDKRGWDTYLATLGQVIARRDASVEPLDMIPTQQVPVACAVRSPTTAFDPTTCARPDVAARANELRLAN